jgi:hypothetical protein
MVAASVQRIRSSDMCFRCSVDYPTGKSMRESEKSKSSPDAKNIRFSEYPNHFYNSHCLVPHEGRLAIVTDAGRDAMDAEGASDESA